MKKSIVIIAVLSMALAGLCLYQTRRFNHEKERALALQEQAETQARQVADLQTEKERSASERQDLTRQIEQANAQFQAQQTTASRAVATPAPAPTSTNAELEAKLKGDPQKGGLATVLDKMRQNPEMKNLIRQQQRMMMDQLYGPLVKKLGLTEEETTKFKDLLADNAMKAVEKSTALLSGGAATNRTELMAAMAAEQKSQEEQLRGLFGDERFAQYQDYQKTAGERMQLNLFKQQSSDLALTEAQTEQLLTVMKEEKETATAGGAFSDLGQTSGQGAMQAALSNEQMEKTLAAQEEVNLRVYERARTVLSEEQMNAFGKFQTNQLSMMRMGLSMTRQFLTPGGGEGDTGAGK
jgi:hypothetical protein